MIMLGGARMEWRPGENRTMGKTEQLLLLEGGEKKEITTPIAGLWGMKGGLSGLRGADNLPQARTPSGRRKEEPKRNPQLAPAATYPRAAAPSCTLRSFTRARARALPGHPERRGGRAWTFALSCPWKPQRVHKLRDGAGGGAEPGSWGTWQQSQRS